VQFRPEDLAAVRLALDVLAGPDEGDPDIPVGAVVLSADGQVLGTGRNQRTATNDPTAHAEVVALRAAAAAAQSWRLAGCTLAVTLEPCPMCAGAAASARIARLVFGAWNPEYGAAGSVFDLVRDRRGPHRAEVVGGVLEAHCAAVLRDFFEGRRS
jgi:tRNA(adenine34) deaminase